LTFVTLCARCSSVPQHLEQVYFIRSQHSTKRLLMRSRWPCTSPTNSSRRATTTTSLLLSYSQTAWCLLHYFQPKPLPTTEHATVVQPQDPLLSNLIPLVEVPGFSIECWNALVLHAAEIECMRRHWMLVSCLRAAKVSGVVRWISKGVNPILSYQEDHYAVTSRGFSKAERCAE
jgi:hypothetical protein